MTIRERAADVVKSMECEMGMPHLAAIKIEKAITAAVEEERAACAKLIDNQAAARRAAVEQEREACAKIAEQLRDVIKAEAEQRMGGGNSILTLQVVERYSGVAGTAELIYKLIRARSTADTHSTGGEK